MKNFVCMRLALFFCMFLSLNCILKAQTSFVKITPLNKYEFEINNDFGYPIEVHIDEKISYRLLPQTGIVVDTKEIHSSSMMRLKYTQTDAVQVKNDVIRLLTKFKELNWATSVVNDFWGALQEKEQVNLKEIAVFHSENGVLETRLEEELELLEEDLRVSADLFAASNGEENHFSTHFEPFPIYPLMRSKKGLTPLVNVIWDFPIKKQDFGDFWGRKSSNMNSEIQFSVGLRPELRWGKGQIFSSLHGFVAVYRPVYGLLPEEDIFYVSDTYLENAPNSVAELLTGEYINLNLNHLSGGMFVRTFFYPRFFFDIGAGYIFHQSARLHFDPTDENGEPVFHLPEGVEFERKKTKNIADIDMKKWYGLFRVGFHFSKMNYKKPIKGSYSVEGFYVVASIRASYKPVLTANEEYEFYYVNGNNDLQFVPLSDNLPENGVEDKMRLIWKLGVGLGL